MSTIIIKVIIETNKLVYRDIAIDGKQSLEDLHFAILNAFDFEGKQMASFLKTTGGWQADKEYPLELLGDDAATELMKSIEIQQVLTAKGDAISYLYDYMSEWKFEIEVVELKKETCPKPKVTHSHGKAPKESEKSLSGEDASKILMNEILGEDFEEEEGDEDLFNSGDFDSLDDYEEFQ